MMAMEAIELAMKSGRHEDEILEELEQTTSPTEELERGLPRIPPELSVRGMEERLQDMEARKLEEAAEAGITPEFFKEVERSEREAEQVREYGDDMLDEDEDLDLSELAELEQMDGSGPYGEAQATRDDAIREMFGDDVDKDPFDHRTL